MSFTITINVTSNQKTIGFGASSRFLDTVLPQIGEVYKDSVRQYLGTSIAYTLVNTYAFAKEQGKTRPRMKRYAGKDYGQPLILSGVMYEGVDFWRAGNVVNIGVKEPNGHSPKGFDYAGFWEDNAGYLEGGMNLVRDSEIDAILDRAITDIVGF